MAVVLRCPDCEGKFKWAFTSDSQWPKYCPLCSAYMGTDRADDDIVMPFIKSVRTKANDKLYRDMEAGSERRAEMAAEMAGVPVSEMSDLKITNLNDRRDAEVAAMPVQNPVTQHMDAMQQHGAQFGFAAHAAAEYSGAVQTGPAPNAGAKMRTALQQHHGRITVSHSSGVSDMPALETKQPGYRIRG